MENLFTKSQKIKFFLLCLVGLFAASDCFFIGTRSCPASVGTNSPSSSRLRKIWLRNRLVRCKQLGALSMAARQEDKGEPLTAEKVASMIEVSFVEGVMQLSQGYVETIKLFIAAVLTGYGMGVPNNVLIEQVKACPVQSANRPLMKEEEDLRTTWIKLVYLIAQQVQYRQAIVQDAQLLWTNEDHGNSDEWTVYETILPRLREKHANGNEAGPRFRAQEIMEENADILSNVTVDPMEKALVLQNLRVMWITLTVMEEEKLCQSDQEPLAPPIPNELDSN